MNEITAPAELQPHATSMPIPHKPQGSQLLSVVVKAISDPSFPMERIEWLWARQRELEAEDRQRLFDIAMSEAQSNMSAVRKDALNGHTKSKYATYAALDDAIRPAYTGAGISISFDEGEDKAGTEDELNVIAIITHASGHRERRHINIAFTTAGAKGTDFTTKTHAKLGAMTYGQRKLLSMIFNIATRSDDDDGNAAAGVGGGTITGDQVDTLRAMIEDIELPIDKFCEYMKVDGVMKILKKDYDKAVFVIGQAAGQKKQRSVK